MVLYRKSSVVSPVSRAVSATVEPLERRQLLSTVQGGDIDGDLIPDIKVTGTSGTDRITIYMDPLHNFAAVHDDRNGNGQIDTNELSYGGQFETIDVSTLGGNDTVNVRLLSDLAGSLLQNAAPIGLPPTKGFPLPVDEYYGEGISVYVDLGTGNDKFEISSPVTALAPNIESELSLAAGFDVNSQEGGADIVEGGDLVVQVDGGNDKDTINFDFSRTSVICSSLIATTDAGAGDDTVNLRLPNFAGDGSGTADQPEEGIVACFEYDSQAPEVGIGGKDTIPGGEGLMPSNVSIAIDLGAGKNTLNIYTNTVISASDVHIEVDGGKDTDIINDNESIIATSYVVTLGVPTAGSESNEPGRYVVDIELGSGNDTYYQNADFSGLEQRTTLSSKAIGIDDNGEVTYNVRGDSGKDIIRVKDADNGLPIEENTAIIRGLLEYNLYGGNDDDNVQFDTDPGSQFSMQGGELKVLVSCDGGNDFGRIDVVLVPDFVAVARPLLDPAILTLSGGSGNDKLGMMVGIPQIPNYLTKGALVLLPPGFFGPRGYPLLDGGSGSDRSDLEGNVFIVTRGAETNDESIEPAYVP